MNPCVCLLKAGVNKGVLWFGEFALFMFMWGCLCLLLLWGVLTLFKGASGDTQPVGPEAPPTGRAPTRRMTDRGRVLSNLFFNHVLRVYQNICMKKE